MKKIALIVSGLLISTVGFAGVGQDTGKTTCHIYHKNKLLKSLTCSYDRAEGAGGTYAFRTGDYKIPGFGVMNTSFSVDGYDSNGRGTGTTVTLNDEPAIRRYRLPSNKKIVSNTYAETHDALECYLSKKSQWEICT